MSSYDDMFNAGMFNLARKNSSLQGPKMWPSHVSAMRKHTSYEDHGHDESIPSGFYSDYMYQRAHPGATPVHNPLDHGQYRAASARGRAQQAARIKHAARLAAARAQLIHAPHTAQTAHGARVTDARKWEWREGKA